MIFSVMYIFFYREIAEDQNASIYAEVSNVGGQTAGGQPLSTFQSSAGYQQDNNLMDLSGDATMKMVIFLLIFIYFVFGE